MRARFFRRLLLLFEKHTPTCFRRIQLQILMNVTAGAFQTKALRLWHKKPEGALAEYAAFTKRCMENLHADAARMYRMAFKVGAMLRRVTGFSERADLQRLVFLLYRNIGITMQGELPGKVVIPVCYFSRTYLPVQCAMISALDSGIVAGIFGGGQLVFTERITEGCDCCTACLKEVAMDA